MVVYRFGAALRFLAVSLFGARPPVHFGDLELTGTKKVLPLLSSTTRNLLNLSRRRSRCGRRSQLNLSVDFEIGFCLLSRVSLRDFTAHKELMNSVTQCDTNIGDGFYRCQSEPHRVLSCSEVLCVAVNFYESLYVVQHLMLLRLCGKNLRTAENTYASLQLSYSPADL